MRPCLSPPPPSVKVRSFQTPVILDHVLRGVIAVSPRTGRCFLTGKWDSGLWRCRRRSVCTTTHLSRLLPHRRRRGSHLLQCSLHGSRYQSQPARRRQKHPNDLLAHKKNCYRPDASMITRQHSLSPRFLQNCSSTNDKASLAYTLLSSPYGILRLQVPFAHISRPLWTFRYPSCPATLAFIRLLAFGCTLALTRLLVQ